MISANLYLHLRQPVMALEYILLTAELYPYQISCRFSSRTAISPFSSFHSGISNSRRISDFKEEIVLAYRSVLPAMNSSIQWTVLASAAFIVLLLPTALGRHAPVQSHSEINKPNLLNVNVEESKASTPVGKDTKDAIFKSSVSAEPHVRAEGYAQEQKMLEIAGSSLPYCAHACGACSPCRRVAVSFKCSLAEGSESCPMAYRCMCRGKTFPIP